MELPYEIKNYIENELNSEDLKELKNNVKNISTNYRENKRTGKSLLSKESEAIAYAIYRMPATFGAISSAIEKTLEIYNTEIKSVADIGAGTGTASIAVNELINNIKKIECFEREETMLNIGKKIFENYKNLKDKTIWKNIDITQTKIEEKYDLVISAYMFNELKQNQMEIITQKIWDIANDLIIIIEPGTMQGYENIMIVKKKLIELGGKIIAPCMLEECPLPKDDWCNFYSRVQRSKIHKTLKSGISPFEDEKFIYIAISKNEIKKDKKQRIIRHPLIYNGYIKMKTCSENGIQEITVTKKNKENYKIAKKSKQGDLL